jgi:hypothetical protein
MLIRPTRRAKLTFKKWRHLWLGISRIHFQETMTTGYSAQGIYQLASCCLVLHCMMLFQKHSFITHTDDLVPT